MAGRRSDVERVVTASAVGTNWRVVAASVEGTSHAGTDLGCQDAHAVATLDGGLVIAVADGAGSAPRAGEGAGVAVAAAIGHAMANAAAHDDDPAGLATGCVDAARFALEEQAADDDLGELATTLLVVVALGSRLGMAQVGDGAVIVDTGVGLQVVGAVERGEYLNETTFLTSSAWANERRVDRVDGSLEGVAVMSDGLQLLALDLAAMEAHVPFFEPLWAFARAEGSTSAELAAFLASERVCARTDDDKTLVLAVVSPDP
jgi:hypothetical protein